MSLTTIFYILIFKTENTRLQNVSKICVMNETNRLEYIKHYFMYRPAAALLHKIKKKKNN